MRQTLEQTLNELHDQLAGAQDLDEAQRTRLRQAVQEIQQTLDDSKVSSASLATQLKQAVALRRDACRLGRPKPLSRPQLAASSLTCPEKRAAPASRPW